MAETLPLLMVPAPASATRIDTTKKFVYAELSTCHVIWWGFHFNSEAFDGFIDIAPLRRSDRPCLRFMCSMEGSHALITACWAG